MLDAPLPIVVQKYGGSSVDGPERLSLVAERVAATVDSGYRVVVVISAMGKTTDALMKQAREVNPNPTRRELDMLLTAGERIASSLLAMAISHLGKEAISFTGSQCGIMTNHRHSNARIIEVRPVRVHDELDRGRVVIIAGFQGVSYKREITTLGRGGSDTTAVAMAAALGAEYCEICSDVDGVYSADPRVVAEPRHIEHLSYSEMQELAQSGAQVLNAQAVEFARRAGIAIYARATAGGKTTRIAGEAAGSKWTVSVAGISGLVCVHGDGGAPQLTTLVRTLEEQATNPLRARLHEGQPVLMISRVNCPDYPALRARLEQAKGSGSIWFEEELEAVTVVGEGLGDDPCHLARALALIESEGLPLHSVDTAPLRLSFFLKPGRLDEAIRLMHGAFVERQPELE